MKHIKLITTIALWLVGAAWLNTAIADGINTLFTPIYPQTHSVGLSQVFSRTDSITDFDPSRSINGFAVSATIVQPSSQSMVRFILIDTAGNEYLVGESCRLLNDKDTVSWTCHSEETCSLPNVHPAKLKIAVKDATVTLHGINMSESGSATVSTLPEMDAATLRRQQVEQKVAAINAYNRNHDKLWLAGVTEQALRPYAEKKIILNLSDEGGDTEGIEYYVGGIFEIGEPSATTAANNQTNKSPYVDEFDWRNRHGINWVTPCKNQGGSKMCTFFATAGAVEAVVNLYYNKKIDLDLSEVDLALYGAKRSNYRDAYNRGTSNIKDGFEALKNGISDEESIPFIDSPICNFPKERPQSKERIYIDSYDNVLHSQIDTISFSVEDSIKKYLIQKGPMVSGYVNKPGHSDHAMTLVGYRQLKARDTIYIVETGYYVNWLQDNDKRIGMTCWIFKNSLGSNYGLEKDGYFYVLFYADNKMYNPYYVNVPITSQNYTDKDIKYTDNDGDGYFFWGLGPRPENLPSWAEEEPDGNDSDYNKGPMNEFGYCMNITPNEKDTLFITHNTTWNERRYFHQHVVICENASLIVNDSITFYKGCSLTIEGNSSLVVDNGNLDNVILKPAAYSSIKIQNEGVVILNKEEEFELPINSNLEIMNGTLQ